jgi:hypothetical protein
LPQPAPAATLIVAVGGSANMASCWGVGFKTGQSDGMMGEVYGRESNLRAQPPQ